MLAATGTTKGALVAKFITIHHPGLKLQHQVAESAFTTAKGLSSKGWKEGPLPDKKEK